MYVAAAIKDDIKQFEKNNNKYVRGRLRGGHFVGDYDTLKDEIRKIDKICKKNRHDYLAHLDDYNASYDMCRKVEKLIEEVNDTETLIQGTKRSLFWTIFGWVTSIGISVLAGIYGDAIWTAIKSMTTQF